MSTIRESHHILINLGHGILLWLYGLQMVIGLMRSKDTLNPAPATHSPIDIFGNRKMCQYNQIPALGKFSWLKLDRDKVYKRGAVRHGE